MQVTERLGVARGNLVDDLVAIDAEQGLLGDRLGDAETLEQTDEEDA